MLECIWSFRVHGGEQMVISVLSLICHTRGCGPEPSWRVVFVLKDTVAQWLKVWALDSS